MTADIQRGDQHFFVSTTDTFDHGWETMVFVSDGDHVTNWSDLFCCRYKTYEEAAAGHARVVAEWQPEQ